MRAYVVKTYIKAAEGKRSGIADDFPLLPFMETKNFCFNCKVHCYKADMRQKIREVMRFSGLRMIFHHPILAIRHVIESKKEKK